MRGFFLSSIAKNNIFQLARHAHEAYNAQLRGNPFPSSPYLQLS
jgi:hypothetical protein